MKYEDSISSENVNKDIEIIKRTRWYSVFENYNNWNKKFIRQLHDKFELAEESMN